MVHSVSRLPALLLLVLVRYWIDDVFDCCHPEAEIHALAALYGKFVAACSL